ncbi:cytochrome c3 family protein [Desulfosporosinus sp. Sb-LF]|uniref:cytochrome c3 family protein n=1 Tax=Desulfosporosinus sp. Sb-LF TaxID=2560027 RepID=UPI001305318E|nr:cytochrome c3 family protein [Desulfosporosinus sp. Sb-LF]
MSIFSKRCLLLMFFGGIICLSIFWSDQLVKAADGTEGINDVSVEIGALQSDTSQITLSWRLVPPANGGTISYDIEKSTDGGLTFVPIANISVTTWTDNNGGNGVPNYTNVIYRLRSEETVGGTSTPSPYGWPVKVFPPNINIHDNYMSNTNLCSNCHSTHNGKADQLLTLNNVTTTSALCLTCHEGATNSKYDVNNGYTKTENGIVRSLGGAFAHNGNGDAGEPWGGVSTTSAHKVDETTAEPAPGYGGTNASQPMTLGCTSCHSAHGTGNYRMLKNTIAVPTAPDTSTSYDVSVVAGAVTKNPSSGENPVYFSGAETLCQSCHGDYTTGKSGHPVNATLGALTTSLPLEGTTTDRDNNTLKMTCLTCHYSHGSTSDNITVSSGNDLCWKCHVPAQYGMPSDPDTTTSGFSNTSQQNLHNFSGTSGGHLGTCSSCHITHGDNVKGLLVGASNPITAIDNKAGTGQWEYSSCTTSCHQAVSEPAPDSGA